MLLLNVLLAIAWNALTGEFSATNLIIGFVLGYMVLWLVAGRSGNSHYFMKAGQILSFAAFFLWELVVASLRVAFDVLTPQQRAKPGVVAVPLEVQRDIEITLLASLITLTPGTLTLDVSPDRRTLYVHTMYLRDADQFRQEIKNGFERRVREVFQ